MEILTKESKNGIVISGLVSWLNIQRDTNAEGIWITVALEQFNPDEVTEATKAVESVFAGDVKGLKEKIPNYSDRRKAGENKKKTELGDIRDMLKLYETLECMPVILATSEQMKRCPQFWGEQKTEDVAGIVENVKMLKQVMTSYIEGNNQQMADMRREMSSMMLVRPRAGSILRQQPATMEPPTTPGGTSKRQRVEEQGQGQGPWAEQVEQEQTWADRAGQGVQHLRDQQNQGLGQVIQKILGKKSNIPTRARKIFGNAKTTEESNDEDFELAADVELAVFGVRKDVTETMMIDHLKARKILVKEVKTQTRPDVLESVRTITMKVTVPASQHEAAMKPEVWPYRVGVGLWDNRSVRRERQERLGLGTAPGRGEGAGAGAGAGAGGARGAGEGLLAGAGARAGESRQQQGWQQQHRRDGNRGAAGGGQFRGQNIYELLNLVANLN